jgi:nicotinate-nucleotide adenylyltransferase
VKLLKNIKEIFSRTNMGIKKIGIMGGTFDPIHNGHLVVANEVLNIYNLDKIIFIPAGNPPHKKGPRASSQDRFFMAGIATLSNEKFEVSDIEIKKAEKSYTLNTLRELKAVYPETEIYFITGSDAIVELQTWHEPEELLKLCRFIAVLRPGSDKYEVLRKIEEIKKNCGGTIDLLSLPMLQISSTDIREIFREGRSAKYLLPEAVELYIIKNNLYAEKS